MLDVYTPISAQHKHLKKEMTELIIRALLKIGYEEEDIEIRSFNGGHYPGTEEVVKDPHMLILIVDHIGTKIGRGAASEIAYAKDKGMPVFVATNSPEKLHILQDTINHNKDDWRNFCGLKAKELSRERFIETLNNFGVLHKSGLIELTENVERVTNPKKRLLLV